MLATSNAYLLPFWLIHRPASAAHTSTSSRPMAGKAFAYSLDCQSRITANYSLTLTTALALLVDCCISSHRHRCCRRCLHRLATAITVAIATTAAIAFAAQLLALEWAHRMCSIEKRYWCHLYPTHQPSNVDDIWWPLRGGGGSKVTRQPAGANERVAHQEAT
jgi:hypothetical protein